MRWLEYKPENDTMLDWSEVKDLAALDKYSKRNLHLNLALVDVFDIKSVGIIYRRTAVFMEYCEKFRIRLGLCL